MSHWKFMGKFVALTQGRRCGVGRKVERAADLFFVFRTPPYVDPFSICSKEVHYEQEDL